MQIAVRTRQASILAHRRPIAFQPCPCNFDIAIIRLKAEEGSSDGLGRKQRCTTASKRVEHELPWLGGNLNQRLHQANRLLHGMQTALARLIADVENVVGPCHITKERRFVIRANAIYQCVIGNCGSDLVGLGEPKHWFECRP